ncbi:Uncharacterised protein [Salmonella enterica subsp. enterica serovar Bovismorbificans]|uniref:Uncharacterized protein n=1 Tax=Salmonella enterica subsp. enterica serovar Bovismorbificans TaxID=58097 RepID=A0A655D9I6_SALET|nr:Uncharacterised protein [Salmonella enterica subsp. enterica serovar Bovismorbificans]CPR50249.1 Uncharacterised protein [Salmonella enterica subsp. enterica serovar Bovismorbificans]
MHTLNAPGIPHLSVSIGFMTEQRNKHSVIDIFHN